MADESMKPGDPNQAADAPDTTESEAYVFGATYVPAALCGAAGEGYLTVFGAKKYLDDLKAKFGATGDPTAEMLVEQIALTRCRSVRLQYLASRAEMFGEEKREEDQLRKKASQIFTCPRLFIRRLRAEMPQPRTCTRSSSPIERVSTAT